MIDVVAAAATQGVVAFSQGTVATVASDQVALAEASGGQGLRGAPGRDGRDSIVPGPPGQNAVAFVALDASPTANPSLLARLAALAPSIAPPSGDALLALPGIADLVGITAAGLVASVDLTVGTPLAIERASGRVVPARADTYDLVFVFGHAQHAAGPGDDVAVARLLTTLDDWTAIAGTQALTVGRPYFLASAGGLTLEPPTKPLSLANVRVGEAVTPRTLVYGYAAPIIL